MRQPALGALIGFAVGGGLAMVVAWLAARRPPRVGMRIRHHVLGPSPDSALLRPQRPRLRPVHLDERLARAGSRDSRAHYRLEQVAWAALGGCAGAALAMFLGAPVPIGPVVLGGCGAALAAMAREWRLARRTRRRRLRLEEQLPAVADLLALAISAGETPYSALVRVSRRSGGELAHELADVVDHVRSGVGLEVAMRRMAERCSSPAVGRFVDGMLLAIERGTPLSEVMRAQADDVRSDARRRLMELAGRKDVAMLVPVVFLILPAVVVVAVYPGLQSLRIVAP